MPRGKEFLTDDGHRLRFDPDRYVWTDGDLVYETDADGNLPVDARGCAVPGELVYPEVDHA